MTPLTLQSCSVKTTPVPLSWKRTECKTCFIASFKSTLYRLLKVCIMDLGVTHHTEISHQTPFYHFGTKLPLYVSKRPEMYIGLKRVEPGGNKINPLKTLNRAQRVEAAVDQHLWHWSRWWLGFDVTHYSVLRKHVLSSPLLALGRKERIHAELKGNIVQCAPQNGHSAHRCNNPSNRFVKTLHALK